MLRVAARRLSSFSASPWRSNQAATASSLVSRNLINGGDYSSSSSSSSSFSTFDELRSTSFKPQFHIPCRGLNFFSAMFWGFFLATSYFRVCFLIFENFIDFCFSINSKYEVVVMTPSISVFGLRTGTMIYSILFLICKSFCHSFKDYCLLTHLHDYNKLFEAQLICWLSRKIRIVKLLPFCQIRFIRSSFVFV